MTHDDARLLAAAAALDDLSPDERHAWEAHRSGCAACGRLEAELDGVLAELALVAPARALPRDLLPGIRAAIRAAGPRGAGQDAWISPRWRRPATTARGTRAPGARRRSP